MPPPSSIQPSSSAAASVAPPNPDNLKDKILTTLGGDDPVIMAFSSLSLQDIHHDVDRLIREAVKDKSPEVRKHALQQINLTLQDVNVNPARVKMILNILSSAVKDAVLSGREVCECLKELLNTDIESLSMELLNFFDVLIGCTDHKICQEIFTICIQETSKLPSVLSGIHHRVASKIKTIFVKLLDRENLVMPPICSYCDIMIAFDKPNVHPHWSVCELLNEYVSTFTCLTHLMTIENTEQFRPVIGHSSQAPLGWKLDQTSLTFHTVNPSSFILRFCGPYSQAQTNLMLYTLKETHCRDFVVNTMLMLRQGKGTICPVMEEVFMKLIKETAATSDENDLKKIKHWERLGGELSSLIFSSAVHLKNITESLLKELKQHTTFSVLYQHRDFLMWTLHRLFSFCLKIIRVPRKEFLYIADIIKLLYPEQTALPLPDLNSPLSVVYLSAASLWSVFTTRSSDNPGILDPTPGALVEHINLLKSPHHQYSLSDFTVCIALSHINDFIPNFVNTPEAYSNPMRFLMESLYMSQQTTLLPGNVQVVAALTPIPLDILDLLTAHAKMNFIVTITNHINKMADPHDALTQSSRSPGPYLAPALLETFARLLSYTEIDSNSLKMMMNLIVTVHSNHSYGILCSLLEMFVYRMQFVKQTTHRMTMLTHCQSLAALFQQTGPGSHPQMLYMLESFAMRVLQLLNYHDHTRISSSPAGIKILSTSSAELNKLFILTAARSAVVSGNKMSQNAWLKPFMDHMIAQTPTVRDWSPYTLTYFPQSLLSYCSHPDSYTAKNLTMLVNDALTAIQQAGLKHDVAKFYKESDQNDIFMCILLRKVLETDALPNYATKVTQQWTAATLRKQIRNMIDFILLEVKSTKGATPTFTKITNTLSDFVFRYYIMSFDTLLTILSLHKYSEQDANISFFLIYNLLIKKMHFRDRCEAFVNRASPDFWKAGDWSDVHYTYHSKFPEHQYWMRNEFMDQRGGNTHLPIYFSNLSLRFVPVLDVVIHRMIELPPKNSRTWLIEILRTFSGLFAYHDSPITYVHNTLFYYDLMLASERDLEKRVLVRSYLEHQTCKPMEFLSAQFLTYVKSDETTCKWEPSPGYFLELVMKMNDVIKSSDGPEFSAIDWRYNEFGNPVCMMLYLTAIELMSIPLPTNIPVKSPAELLADHRLNIGTKLVDIALSNTTGHLPELCNTLGILLSALPVAFSHAVYRKILEILKDNFYEIEGNVGGVLWNNKAQNVLTLVHSFFQHCKADKIGYLPEFITQNMNLFSTESKVVYILKLVSPFLCHLFRTPTVRNQTLYALYQAMLNLLGESSVSNPDLFVDYMYYIKYIYAGTEFKPLVEKHLPLLPADIAAKLKLLVIGKDAPS